MSKFTLGGVPDHAYDLFHALHKRVNEDGGESWSRALMSLLQLEDRRAALHQLQDITSYRISVEVDSCDVILGVAYRMVNSFRSHGTMPSYTHAVFDGVDLYGGGGDTVDDIVAQYHREKSKKK